MLIARLKRFCLICILAPLAACTSNVKYRTTGENASQPRLELTQQTRLTKPKGKPFPLYHWLKKEAASDDPGIQGTLQNIAEYAILAPFDVIATIASPFWGYEKLHSTSLTGELWGKVITHGTTPTDIKLEISVADSPWEFLHVNDDGSFVYITSATIPASSSKFHQLDIKFRFPWEEELQHTGEVLQPNPDLLAYVINTREKGSIDITDSSGTITRMPLIIETSFNRVVDKNVKAEIAKRNSEPYKLKAIGLLADDFSKQLPSLNGHEEMILTSAGWEGVFCQSSYHTHSISWLNAEKTRAKVTVELHGKYPTTINPFNGNTTYETKDYQGGTFVCEQDESGDWHIQ
jgi:hypothetical protein